MSYIFSSKSSSPQPLTEDAITHDLADCDEAASRNNGSDILHQSHMLITSHKGPSCRDDLGDFLHRDNCDTASFLHHHDLSPKSCYDVETDDFRDNILRDRSDPKSSYFRTTPSSHKSDKINYYHDRDTKSCDHYDQTSNNNNFIKDINHLDHSCDFLSSANGDSYHRTFLTENFNSYISESHDVEYVDDKYNCTSESSRDRKAELWIQPDLSVSDGFGSGFKEARI